MKREQTEPDDTAVELPPPSYRTAAGVSALTLLLYLVTMSPTIGLWDAGEYIAAAAGLGIPHPPGNPGFVLLGRVASLLPIAPTVAGRLNVLVAVASALSAGLWFLATEHIARRVLSPRRAQLIAAVAALLGATAFTVWNQSVVNEKVYTISLFLLALDFWATLRWQAAPDGKQADRRLLMLCFRLGIGYTIHIAGLLAGPALLAAVLYTRPRTLRRYKLLLACGGVFILGLSPYAMLPIRAAFRLEINEGHPTACEDGAPQLGCTLSKQTLDRFLYQNNRTQYAKPPLTERQESLPNQVKMWWLYYKWQWFRNPSGSSPDAQGSLAVAMLLLAGLGGYTHYRTDRRTFVPFATLIVTLTAGLIFYLNFKLGYTQAAAMGIQDPSRHEVRDRDYFYLWSYSALPVWIALGLAYVWRWLATYLADDGEPEREIPLTPGHRQWAIAAPVLAIALVPLFVNWNAASRRHETFPEDFAVDMLNSVEPNAVLFTGGDNDSFPLWFAQQVLGVRRDVNIVLLPYLATDWYLRELIAKTPVPYDPATGPVLYKGFPRTATAPLLRMSRVDAGAIPPETQLFQATNVQLKGFTVDLPAGSKVRRDELAMLRIIQDAGSTRPIYFSNGAGSESIDRLLGPRFITHGLASKLVADPAGESGAVLTRYGWIDFPRSLAAWKTFRAPAALERQGRWIDAPSINAPYLYMRLGTALSLKMDSTVTPAALVSPAGSSARVAAQEADALKRQLERMTAAIDFMSVVGGSSKKLEARSGLGYAPVTGP